MSDVARALDVSLRLGREAAEAIMAVRKGGALAVRDKGHDDPVTAADYAANAILTAGLAREFPGYVLVSEENDPSTYADYRTSEKCFFVDPLDGTKDFVRGGDDFCVMIGLVESGIVVMGVVVCPATGEAAYADARGAFLEAPGHAVRRLALPSPPPLEEARILVSSSHRSADIDARLQRLGARELVPRGSVGVKVLRVCAGDADAYVHPAPMAGRRWDVAAPQAIAAAAGGRICDRQGRDFDYRSASLDNEGILCGHAKLLEDALARVAEPS